MQLARHPHELDLITQAIDQRRALALGPARHLELAQKQIDAAIFLQHGDAFRLGRMRGDHRADAQARQERLDHPRRHALGGGLGQHVVERAAQARPPARPLDLPAPAHGGVLLGDRQKLKPDALRLKRPRHQLGREAVGIGAALEHRLDLGLMLAHHLDEEREQELGRFLGRGAADQCLHRLGRSRLLYDLLVHGGLT